MTSSSNILSQPNATFNNRQLEKFVESEEKVGANGNSNSNNSTGNGDISRTSPTVATTTTTTATSAKSGNGIGTSKALTDSSATATVPATTTSTATVIATTASSNSSLSSNSSSSVGYNQVRQLTSSLVTPVRQLMRLNNGGGNENLPSSVADSGAAVRKEQQQQQPVVSLDAKSNKRSAAAAVAGIETKLGSDSNANVPVNAASLRGHNLDNSLAQKSSPKSGSLFAQSAAHPSLVAVKLSFVGEKNAKTSNNNKTTTTPNNQQPSNNSNNDDDDEAREQKRVEQLYGDDCGRVQAAAIVIQRAFRKYQICQRFRTITEQLRHTSSATPALPAQTTLSSPEKGIQVKPANRQRELSALKSTPSTKPSSGAIGTVEAAGVTYAAGTTRAAAWESLSQAASRLAAQTAAATNSSGAKQSLSRSSSSQQVIGVGGSSTAATTAPNGRLQAIGSAGATIVVPQVAAGGTVTTPTGKQHDPVFAAAINFQQLESIRKRQYRVGLNIFNKSPEKGISFLVAHSFIDCSSPYAKASTGYYQSNQLHLIDKHLMQQQASSNADIESCQLCYEEENLKRNVAHFLLQRKGLAKEKIGQYLGNLQESFNQDVLRYYLQELDFNGMQIDLALRKFSSAFRLPGEAQKIERLVDRFAQRYVQCQQAPHSITTNNSNANIPMMQANHQQQTNQLQPPQQQQQQQLQLQQSASSNYKNNLIMLTKDEIFILTFAIIMLNTDLHSPSLKPTSRMSVSQFVNNLRGVFKSQMINESDLIEIYDRVKANQITTTPDHVTHVMKVQQGLTVNNFQKKELPNLCVPHRRLVCFCRLFEVYDVNKKERVGQHQREIFLFNDMLLVTKLARRPRANTPQTYTYRQSISLQGLYVQLFQSAHYSFGIRLCLKANDETLIMFNARNELDQSRFVDDLSESIAEMDEMTTIKANNIIDTIHFKHQERLRRHSLMHITNETSQSCAPSNDINYRDTDYGRQQLVCDSGKQQQSNTDSDSDNGLSLSVTHKSGNKQVSSSTVTLSIQDEPENFMESSTPTSKQKQRRMKAKFSSMSNLSSVAESSRDDDSINAIGAPENIGSPARGLRQNYSFSNQPDGVLDDDNQSRAEQRSNSQRRCSASSVHSLDSGLFSSRDVSPNQSS